MPLLRAYVALSRLRTLQGDTEGAGQYWQLAEQLERMSKLQGRSTVLSVARVRRWLEQGNLDAVEAWAAENTLGPDDDYGYHREAYYLMLARYLIARGNSVDQALTLLRRMVERAETSRRHGSLIRALIVQALAFHAGNNSQSAVDSLARALTLADQEQPLRVFADEGPVIGPLLEKVLEMQRRGQVPFPFSSSYAARLLTLIGKRGPAPVPVRRTGGHHADALSMRELEVLRLLADGLESNEIAERLVIAVDTARKHIKNIYSKLDVHSRWEAIKHAQAHQLL